MAEAIELLKKIHLSYIVNIMSVDQQLPYGHNSPEMSGNKWHKIVGAKLEILCLSTNKCRCHLFVIDKRLY